MTLLNDFPLRNLQFYITPPYVCSYLPDKLARSQVAIPGYLIDKVVYGELIKMGFRRSGLYTYRPYCDGCRACVPVRLLVDDFKPKRAQRRSLKRHGNLAARSMELKFDPQHYQLYRRYQASRHPGGGMDQDSRDQFSHFLLQSNVATKLIEFREGNTLRMVSVVDQLGDGLSSVYTFYDPDIRGSSFGTYNVLWQAQLCRDLGLPHLYLGYWIAQSRKMTYKINFQPLQGLLNDRWQPLPAQG
jgi:arginine-tRNA-protein transferase